MTKTQRAELHAKINGLTHGDLAAIVRQTNPRAKGGRIDAIAKQIVAGAHRAISSRNQPRKTQHG